jgi:hypothetical protein
MSFRYIFIALMVICLSHSAVATETLTNVTNTGSINWRRTWNSRTDGGGLTQAATFTAPTNGNTVLQSFSSYYRNSGASTSYQFQALVYEWNLALGKTVGTALYTQNHTSTAPGSSQPFLVTITPNVTLSGGTTYAVIYTLVDTASLAYNSALPGGGFDFEIGLISTSFPTGGGQWFYNAAGSYSSMKQDSWRADSNWGGTDGSGVSSAMLATFSDTVAVPESSTYGLIGLAALGLALAARRRKLKTA